MSLICVTQTKIEQAEKRNYRNYFFKLFFLCSYFTPTSSHAYFDAWQCHQRQEKGRWSVRVMPYSDGKVDEQRASIENRIILSLSFIFLRFFFSSLLSIASTARAYLLSLSLTLSLSATYAHTFDAFFESSSSPIFSFGYLLNCL